MRSPLGRGPTEIYPARSFWLPPLATARITFGAPLETAIHQPSSNVGLQWRANPGLSPECGRGASARYEPGLSLTI